MFQKYRVGKIYFSFLRALRYLITYKPYYLNHLLLYYITRPLKPKPVIPISEFESFEYLDEIWHPTGGKPRVILKWIMTEWCNYNCAYCPQEHGRDRVRGSYRVHCFDNYSPMEWIRAIDKAFEMREVAVTISGGEPLLDIKNMSSFLKVLLSRTYINNVRITTNMGWNPSSLKDLPNKEKMIFLLSFHPSQTRLEDFVDKAKKIENLGFTIGILNYVMSPEQSLHYERFKDKFRELDLPLHPNPLWYSKPNRERKIVENVLEKDDFYYNTGGVTKGRACFFPSVGYEMNQNGDISVGCFPWIEGNIFKNEIPQLMEGPIKCPHYQCRCFDKYSFIKGFNRNIDLNILRIYGNILRKRFGLKEI